METIVDLVRATGSRSPTRTALLMRAGVRTTRLSYRDLDLRAGAFARLLDSRGTAHGDRVIIWAANQPDWIAAMLGTYLVGAVLVPLDVRSSREFVERVVAQTEPVLGFAGRQQAPLLRDLGIAVIEIDDADLPPGEPFPSRCRPDDLAEIIFTSGTTGDPKGVMLTHRNITSNARAALEVIPLSESTRVVSLLPLSHMFEQIGGCLGPLAAGGLIAFPTSRQPVSLLRTMAEVRPTWLVVVPQVLRLFLAAIEREATRTGQSRRLALLRRVAAHLPMRARRLLFRPVLRRFGGRLEFIAVGGAALDQELRTGWELMGIPILEGYGTTECSPILTITPMHDRRSGSCGRGLPGQELRVAADGEVEARGDHVFAGYWKNPAAGAAALHDGWYRTGDLGSFDADGFLYLKGRKRDLIVLSDGQNVYPEDVEREIAREPGIGDAVVLGVERDGAVRLQAIVVEDTPGAGTEAVRRANARLDARQQIDAVVPWPGDDFPRTHTLKVRRGPVREWLESRVEAAAPLPALEDADPLARVVTSLAARRPADLEGATLGADLGLDSLGRVELLSAIEEELGVYVDDAAIDAATTVAGLRALVERGEQAARSLRFPRWPRTWPVRRARRVLMSGLVFPLLRIGYSLSVRGREHVAAVDTPCLVIANHNMHQDQAMLLMSLPAGFRQRVAIAAAADDIFGSRLEGFLAGLLGNAFPFAREGSGVRESLAHTARLLDSGWNVLLFPEGRLTVLGPTQPFKTGIGLLAVETGAPVLPLRIDVLRPGFREGRWLPTPRARVRVTIGAPLRFDRDVDYATATARLEAAVRDA